MSDKVNKFKVGDVVKIISLEKTISRYSGKGSLLPIGSIGRIKYMGDIDEVYLQDGFYYDTADLKLATKETTNSSNEPIKKTLYFVSNAGHPELTNSATVAVLAT